MAQVETSELIKKVRTIEIKTKGLTRHSAFKGRGMTFSEVREYQYGDDTRNIDWNVTARYNRPFIKIYEEERELTVMLLIDISGSRNFGSVSMLKKNVITEISAVLSFSAIYNNDKIGVIFFSDRIEKYIPPQKGKKHILHIIRELIEFKPESQKTDLSEPLKFLSNVIKKRCTAFIISDYMSPDFENSLKVARKKHDLVALKIYDPREAMLPPVGLAKFRDPETGQAKWIDTSLQSVRKSYEKKWQEDEANIKRLFSRNSIDYAGISTTEDYVIPLLNIFKRR